MPRDGLGDDQLRLTVFVPETPAAVAFGGADIPPSKALSDFRSRLAPARPKRRETDASRSSCRARALWVTDTSVAAAAFRDAFFTPQMMRRPAWHAAGWCPRCSA